MKLILVLLISTAHGFLNSQYKIEGYKKASIQDGKKILMEAESSKGLGNISFEELEKLKITISDSKFIIQAKSQHALYKDGELILTQKAELKLLTPKNKLLFTLKSTPPDDLIYLNPDKNTLTAPSYSFKMKGQVISGRSIVINLNDRSLLFLQPLKDKKVTPPSHF